MVSLAAALSIPPTLGGEAVPGRELVLFVTFCVIVATLVGLGSTLPIMVGALGLGRSGAVEAARHRRDERTVRLAGIAAVLAELDAAEAQGAPAVVASLRRRHGDRRDRLARTADEATSDDPVTEESRLQHALIGVERAEIARAYLENRLTDEARRRIEREIDLEESRVQHALASASLGERDPAS